MRRLLLLCVFALPLFAQGTDVAVTIETDTNSGSPFRTYIVRTVWAGSEPVRNAVLEVDIPADRIGNVGGWDGLWQCERTLPVRCTANKELSSHTGGITIFAFFDRGGSYTVTARLTSSTPDPNPSNNTVSVIEELSGKPALSATTMLDFDSNTSFDPGETVRLRMGVQNYGFAATDVVVTGRLPDGGIFTSAEFEWGDGPQPTCTLTALEVTCRFASLAWQQFGVIDLKVMAPPRQDGGTFPVEASATAAEGNSVDFVHRLPIVMRRQFVVSTDADEGAGSLRQALVDTAALCEKDPCTIRFEGVSVVQPKTSLPDVRGIVRIDGGETKTLLDGALLTAGDALRYRSGCDLMVKRLAIRNFPGHAIDVRDTSGSTLPCGQLLSTWIVFTENELSNNLRGIVTEGLSAEIVNNVIRDHRRAGIFADRAFWTLIRGNTITGNGAAGVFINTTIGQFGVPAGADIVENVIRNNGEFGVARTERGLVNISRNEIAGNRFYGIDLNLDLDTPNRPDDSQGVPNKPVLVDATYDPVSNTTKVRGHLDSVYGGGSGSLDFYASSSLSTAGFPEAEQWLLGNFWVNPGSVDFEATLPGDLRGKWITATTTRWMTVYFAKPGEREVSSDGQRPSGGGTTSELSNAVKVF